MPHYRCVTNLSFGKRRVERGEIVKLEGELADKLLAARAIAPLHTPPLALLPGWTLRAERLKLVGVITGADFLECSPHIIAEVMDVRVETVGRWRERLIEDWLVVRPDKG